MRRVMAIIGQDEATDFQCANFSCDKNCQQRDYIGHLDRFSVFLGAMVNVKNSKYRRHCRVQEPPIVDRADPETSLQNANNPLLQTLAQGEISFARMNSTWQIAQRATMTAMLCGLKGNTRMARYPGSSDKELLKFSTRRL